MPSVIDEPSDLSSPRLNQLYIAAPTGSAAAMRMSLFFSFRERLTPASVPPVPMAQVKPSTLPPVWRQISGPVLWQLPSAFALLAHSVAQDAPSSLARR